MKQNDGFTLVELIIALTIGSVLASLYVQFMGTGLMRSGETIHRLKVSYEINQVIEKVLAAYKADAASDTFDLAVFNSNLGGFNENGVTCSGTFLVFRSGGNLIDANGDGVYETQTSSSGPTAFLLVTASKSNKSIQVLLSD